ncbi:unnamed protein product [Caenorhabditis auriculariae]|uniref:RING-type domain-containing protein n=1 Tax=Caenorhabditis auriculariae TaxID=2777116 RepID=A0A8S1HMA8_9PELO|nr:unnamed protein product [Caenorhabditis auriculariae]
MSRTILAFIVTALVASELLTSSSTAMADKRSRKRRSQEPLADHSRSPNTHRKPSRNTPSLTQGRRKETAKLPAAANQPTNHSDRLPLKIPSFLPFIANYNGRWCRSSMDPLSARVLAAAVASSSTAPQAAPPQSTQSATATQPPTQPAGQQSTTGLLLQQIQPGAAPASGRGVSFSSQLAQIAVNVPVAAAAAAAAAAYAATTGNLPPYMPYDMNGSFTTPTYIMAPSSVYTHCVNAQTPTAALCSCGLPQALNQTCSLHATTQQVLANHQQQMNTFSNGHQNFQMARLTQQITLQMHLNHLVQQQNLPMPSSQPQPFTSQPQATQQIVNANCHAPETPARPSTENPLLQHLQSWRNGALSYSTSRLQEQVDFLQTQNQQPMMQPTAAQPSISTGGSGRGRTEILRDLEAARQQTSIGSSSLRTFARLKRTIARVEERQRQMDESDAPPELERQEPTSSTSPRNDEPRPPKLRRVGSATLQPERLPEPPLPSTSTTNSSSASSSQHVTGLVPSGNCQYCHAVTGNQSQPSQASSSLLPPPCGCPTAHCQHTAAAIAVAAAAAGPFTLSSPAHSNLFQQSSGSNIQIPTPIHPSSFGPTPYQLRMYQEGLIAGHQHGLQNRRQNALTASALNRLGSVFVVPGGPNFPHTAYNATNGRVMELNMMVNVIPTELLNVLDRPTLDRHHMFIAPVTEPQPVGASPQDIEKCTAKIPFVKDIEAPAEETERCTVCLCDFETGDEVRSLRCTHIFHPDCIDKWLVYNKKCPVCRLDVDKPLVVAEAVAIGTINSTTAIAP